MPELPEVEAVAGRVRGALAGRTIVSAHVLRRRICLPQSPAQIARAVAGRRFLTAERKGKSILLRLEGATLYVHLRMTGDLYAVPDARSRPASASAYFTLDDGRALVFDDRRGLGVLRVLNPRAAAALERSLGIDPMSPEFTPERLIDLARRSRSPAKIFLMDQRRLAGLGNIYAAEALFRAGVDPRLPVSRLAPARLVRLHAAIVSVLTDAVKSASLAYQRQGRFVEGESFDPAVYGREGLPCLRCGRRIRRIQQGGRSTYFCPGCQR